MLKLKGEEILPILLIILFFTVLTIPKEENIPTSELGRMMYNFKNLARKHKIPLKYLKKIDSVIIRIQGKEETGFNEGQLAHCNFKKNEILINKDEWAKSDYLEKEAILFHELGHCVLNRAHFHSFANERPISLMYPKFSREVYISKRSDYINELFSRLDDSFLRIDESKLTKKTPMIELRIAELNATGEKIDINELLKREKDF
tara:strand:- start:3729 stop:4340 length:612 start_codon:yes stop_codon:yes gene_type:complete